MTQPVTPWLPGQSPVAGANYGRLALPGVNDQPPAAPYGMTPGQRHVIPDQVNLDAQPVKPDDVNLDGAPGALPSAPTPGVLPQTHRLKSIQITSPDGKVVADMPVNPNTGNDYLKFQVKQIGDSLINQAVTPEDKEAAGRAQQFGLSLVGLMPLKDIQAAVVHRYDTDERNAISREVQDAKTARLKMMGLGGGAAAGPTKQDKFDKALDDSLRKNVNDIITSERTGTKYAALSEQENNVAQGLRLLSSPNAMSQRIAVQQELLALDLARHRASPSRPRSLARRASVKS